MHDLVVVEETRLGPAGVSIDGAGVHRLGWVLVRFFSTSRKTALTLSSPLRGMSHLHSQIGALFQRCPKPLYR